LAFRAVPDSAPLGQPTAFYQPPRPSLKQPGVVLVDIRDVAALPRFDVTTLVAHEGMPGHHLQMASTQETPNLPLLRRLTSCPGFIEGWGVYAEQLVDEMGVYDGDPYGRIGYLRWRLWRAARLVVDTGLHAFRWTREQAIAYLTDSIGDSPTLIAAEVDRYCVWPGQAAAYELGALRITEQMTIAVTKMERHDEDFQISTDRFWALDAHWNQGCERHLVFPRTLVEFQPVVLALRARANAAAASIGNTDEPGPARGLEPL
jgi:uncharacterized protein (DUF885 family)